MSRILWSLFARRWIGVCLLVVGGALASPWLSFGEEGKAKPATKEAPVKKDAPKDTVDKDYSAELPRIEAVEPDKAEATMHVAPGFKVQLVASEPLVNDPVAIAFDEDSRLYIVEMRGYSEHQGEGLSRIRLLEDTDEDGRFDKGSIFAEGLSWPTAVTCSAGGIFVGDPPDMFYMKDTDGDGKADVKEKIYSGFGTSNVQGLMNTLTWGLDNRIHGAGSSVGGEIATVADSKIPAVNIRGRDFAFDPTTRKFESTSGGAQHGLSFDKWGRKFLSSNSDHIQQVMFEDRYLARNPFLISPGARVSIAADGPQAEVFRKSPVEPWRIVRTRLRATGVVPGVVEGGGRPAGYFTGATGVTIYRGDAWPEEFDGLAVVGDVGSNLVHRKRLEMNGVQLVANRIDEKSELVASSDIWFRPAQYANAPDGTLYIMDVYREVIEHPASLPPMIKKHLDLDSGRDRGRIYRIVPDGYKQKPLPKLSKATTAQLVKLLEHPNGWHRETASRLLYERQDRSAIPLLEVLARGSQRPEGRMHALYALDGLKALSEKVISPALEDKHPQVRRHAIRLSEKLLVQSSGLEKKLFALTNDPEMEVRYQLAFSLGETHGAGRAEALALLAQRDGADRWVRLAILSSLFEGAGEVFSLLGENQEFRKSAFGSSFLEALSGQIGRQNNAADVAAVLKTMQAWPDDEKALAETSVRGLVQGLSGRAGQVEKLLTSTGGARAGEIFQQMLVSARTTAEDEKQPAARRADSVRTLALGSFEDSGKLLIGLLDNKQPGEVQAAALSSLGKFTSSEVAPSILEAWPILSPSLRSQAVETLFARPERISALLDAIEEKSFSPAELESARVNLLRSHPNKEIRLRAEKLLSGVRMGRRQDVVDAYRPALKLEGDVERGRLAFRKICVACHKVEGVGYEIGPNLMTVQNRGAETIMFNVLDPSREVNPQFVNYVLVTDDGRSVTGMISSETATSVTLTRAEGQSDTILRVQIDELRATGLSIMPEGLEKEIDQQKMADLIAYLLSLK